MKVTYDPSVDAVYIYLTKTIREPKTRQIDDDIILDFDEQGRLVGIEVLDASKRLDLEVVLSASKEVKRFPATIRGKK
jgi:uncharacterized protein YuzE